MSCLGELLIYTELSIAITKLVWKLDLYVGWDRLCRRPRQGVVSNEQDIRGYRVYNWFLSNGSLAVRFEACM